MLNQLKNLSTPTLLSLTAAFSAVAGAAVGATFALKQLETKYAQQAQEDINKMKQHYKLLYKEDEYRELPVEEAVEENNLEGVARRIAETMQYTPAPDYDEVEVQHVNIFDNAVDSDEFDYEAEVASRSEDAPYILSRDEFMNNESNYQQMTITFYESDGVLADDKDQLMNNIDEYVGQKNLRFGHGSEDPNVVYIRNDRLGVEFEVLQSEGSYTEEVLGFIQHEEYHRPRVRKFRGDDE